MFKKSYVKYFFILLLSILFGSAKAEAFRSIFTITPSSKNITVGVNSTAQVSYTVRNTFGYSLTISSVTAILTNNLISTTITQDTCTSQRVSNNNSCTITMILRGTSTGTDGLNVQVRDTLGRGSQMTTAITVSSISDSNNIYTISGSISSLTTNGLVLQNNGTDDINISNSATSFYFSNKITKGGSYNVTVKTQPSGQTCLVNNGNGTNVNENVSNINISCQNKIAFVTNGGNNTVSRCDVNPTTGAFSNCSNTNGITFSFPNAIVLF